MANEYLTSDELKASRTLTGETFADSDITLAISAASRAMDQLCGRRFWADADTAQVRYYTALTPKLALIDDVITLTSLIVDDDGDGTYNETWTENTDFTFGPFNNPTETPVWPRWQIMVHPLSAQGTFPDYPRALKVTAKFGWTAVPDQIKQATGLLASRLVMRAREAPFGIVQLGLEGVAGRIAREDPDVRFLTGPFVRHTPGML